MNDKEIDQSGFDLCECKQARAQQTVSRAAGPLRLTLIAVGKDASISSGIFLMGSSFTHRLSPPIRQREPQHNNQQTGHIGKPSYEELAIVVPPPAHVPGTVLPVSGAANGTYMLNGSEHAPAPPPCRKSSRGSRRRRRDDRDRDGDRDSDGRIPCGRFPPAAPLLPPYRWCSRYSIVKPYRARHCRIYTVCVLFFSCILVINCVNGPHRIHMCSESSTHWRTVMNNSPRQCNPC